MKAWHRDVYSHISHHRDGSLDWFGSSFVGTRHSVLHTVHPGIRLQVTDCRYHGHPSLASGVSGLETRSM